ncbi:RNA-directed DNA polymerase from mobile element jockey [Eumeta japonica]|uniref:RNA-directed DNA polymerase from mobile element jockey n=1 Tax=Eumeta variegata TaxID=151549 RepID=A0A4C1SJ04_EUMVA|nr:RNA-directed DNA polymerase from mobile element jockey [Eumeta japonica]
MRKACKLRNYVQLRTDRLGTSGGGTVLYYKRSLHCCPVDAPQLINLEVTACKLAMDTLEFDVIAPLNPTHFPDKDGDRPDILDIALMKNVNLKLGCIDSLQRLSSDHRPVLMRLGPTSDDRPRDKKITTNWKKVSIALEEIDTPALNKIPNDIESTNDIDNAIGTLTSHITKVVKKCSRKVPVNSDHPKLPASVRKLMRAKNAALRRASDFPTPANRSHARALQRKVRERVREVRNNKWSALMEGITPTHRAYWQVAKALKSDGYEPVPALKNPDNTLAFEDREKAECLANSIERQCSHTSPPHDPLHTSRIEEEVRQKVSLDPKDDLDPVTLDEVKGLVKNLKTRKAPGLDGISNKAIKCFSSPLLALLVAIFNACLKKLLLSGSVQLALFADDTTLFLRSDSLNHIIPRLQRAINELTQWFQLWRIEVNSEKSAAIYFDFSNIKRTLAVPYNAPTLRISNAPIPWQHNYKYLGITLDKHLHFRDHIQRVSKLAIFYMSRLSGMIGRKSKMSLLNKRTLYTMCIRPVMTYACPVFAHAAPTALQDLQVIQNKFCRRATGAQWYVKNSVLHRDLELPTLSKFMKDASERFFSIAINHTNPLISAAASYEAPPENHFLRRPRNALSDPPDDLTAESTVNGYNSRGAFRTPASLKVPTRVVNLRDSLCRGDPNGSPVGESRADGISEQLPEMKGDRDAARAGGGARRRGPRYYRAS